MPRFAANLTWLFTERPPMERFEAAAAAGFEAVELLDPYSGNPRDIAAALDSLGLTFALMNAPPPNWTGGDTGFAAMPDRRDRFRRDFARALRYAGLLRPRIIHVMAGIAGGAGARETFVANLAWAAAQAPGQTLAIEPINRGDVPGYFLADFDEAVAILDAVGAPNLGLQFDAYHAQAITGDAMAAWDRYGPRAVHVQVAGHPGRAEPAGGAIDYPAFFERLDADGYAGFVSGEYRPAGRTEDGLGWMRG